MSTRSCCERSGSRGRRSRCGLVAGARGLAALDRKVKIVLVVGQHHLRGPIAIIAQAGWKARSAGTSSRGPRPTARQDAAARPPRRTTRAAWARSLCGPRATLRRGHSRTTRRDRRRGDRGHTAVASARLGPIADRRPPTDSERPASEQIGLIDLDRGPMPTLLGRDCWDAEGKVLAALDRPYIAGWHVFARVACFTGHRRQRWSAGKHGASPGAKFWNRQTRAGRASGSNG